MAGQMQYNTSYLFSVEEKHSTHEFNEYMKQHWTDSIIYAGVYLILVFSGQMFMTNRKRFELRPYLALWSGALAIFSIVGALRTVPEFLWIVKNQGLEKSVCRASYIDEGQVTSFWTCLFVLSKVMELGDTLFIVLRKQSLIFLHWYHHITVLLYVWYSYPEAIGSGRWFMVMNYVVHSFMYTYFALRAMRFQVPKWVNMFITSLQLIQMIGGIVASIISFYAMEEGRDCDNNYENLKYCLIMYFSYLVLFSHFFYTTYIVKKPISVHEKKH